MVASFSKVSIRSLPIVDPPIPETGGRIHGPAGELAQILSGQEIRHVAYIEFKPNTSIRRGNHYHRQKTEILYLIAGNLNARYQDVDTGETIEILLTAGDLVTIAPRCAHVYRTLEYSQALEASTVAYDPADTIPHEL